MPQSLHVLSVHIIFSTTERRPWLSQEIRPRLWAYQWRILQNLECSMKTFQEGFLRILKKYQAPYDERYLWD